MSDPARALARRAVASRESLSRLARERVAANAGLLRSFVAGRDDLSGRVFDGSTFAFLRHDCGDGDRVSDRAWAEGILVTPGSFFDDRSRVRVSLGGTPDAMADALAAFGCVLDDL